MSNTTSPSTHHHLKDGAVSHSLIWDLLSEFETLVHRLNYIIDTVSDERYHTSHEFLADLVYDAKEKFELYFKKAGNEKAALGGNDVFVGKEVA